MVRDFRCNGCGTPLKIPANSRAPVRCPSCKTECVIEGLIKNAEMAAKDNINSGIPLTATPAMLHKIIVNALSSSGDAPIDVFQNVEVVREERYCVPAYLFYCNGTAPFNYEAAKWTTHKTAIDLGDRTRVEKEQIKDYHPMSSSSSDTATLFTSANREFTALLNYMYFQLDSNKLVDYEYLAFPADVVTSDSNLPEQASFNEHVKPFMEKKLEQKAHESLSGTDYRSLKMGGSNVTKESVQRVFLGVYRIVYTYNGEEYFLWVSGDGTKVKLDAVPVDMNRKNILAGKTQAMESEVASVPVPKTTNFTIGLVGSIVLGVIIMAAANFVVGLLIGLAGVITFSVLRSKGMRPYHDKCNEIRGRHQVGIDAFNGEVARSVQHFKSQQQALRGIYQGVSGDPSAF